MKSSFHLFGDGLAGTFLAHTLTQADIAYRHYGDEHHNTPPVGFVHLFQGRTFHRDPVEVEAFKVAVDHWRNEPQAKEWRVRRSVLEGDRLHRSAHTETVPLDWRPVAEAPPYYTYSPGFTVDAKSLLNRLRGEAASALEPRREPTSVQGVKLLAVGLGIASRLPHWRWDTNPGRTVEGFCPDHPELRPQALYLHHGLHLGANPNGDGFTMGGRVSSKGDAKNDEQQLASSILQKPIEIRSEWWGERIANALDRQPLIGWLTETEFCFAGFGGRAMFWLPYCCQIARLALACGNNDPIPHRLRADRLRPT